MALDNIVPMRLSMIVATGTGEQLSIDCPNWNPVTGEMIATQEAQKQAIQKAFEEADFRRQQMAMRVLEVNKFRSYFDGQTWMRIVGIIDILAGRISAEDLLMRWYSEAEETAELERIREDHLQAQLNGNS